MAADVSPPRRVLVHGHWTVDGQKMSKSLGNVVAPSSVLDNFPADVVRYYMIKEGGLERDGNWSNSSLRNRYVFLANTWGNLVSRIMSPKMDLRTAVRRCFDESGNYRGVHSLKPEEDDKLRNAIETAIDVYRYNMNVLNFEAALSVLDSLMRAVFPSNDRTYVNLRRTFMSLLSHHGCIPPTVSEKDFTRFNTMSEKLCELLQSLPNPLCLSRPKKCWIFWGSIQ